MLNRETTENRGETFHVDGILAARRESWKCLEEIAKRLEVGMTELDAFALAKNICADFGSSKAWHAPKIRFDEGTLKTFSEPLSGERQLKEDSLFFIDLGPVFDGYEGDVGATFTLQAASPEKKKIAAAAKELFDEVANHWREKQATGKTLYSFAETAAQTRGFILNPRVDGHRVSDFPHAVYFKGGLAEIDFEPAPGLWILEIQIRHPTLELGAFYEDLLIENY
jgi:Xaa-Pro aminopeptidase